MGNTMEERRKRKVEREGMARGEVDIEEAENHDEKVQEKKAGGRREE